MLCLADKEHDNYIPVIGVNSALVKKMFAQLRHVSKEGNWTLDQLNQEQIRALLPAIVYTSIMLLLGMLGNSLVIFVNYTRFPQSSYRFYVLLLGFCDLFMSVIGMPFLIYDALNPYTFSHQSVCKILRFVCYFMSLFSVCTLVLIAIERYRKICKPLRPQISIRLSKRLSFYLSASCAFVLSVPSYFIYGLDQVPTGVPGITGVACFMDMSLKDTPIPLAYNIIIATMICFCGVWMIHCYNRIRVTVRKRSKLGSLPRTKFGFKGFLGQPPVEIPEQALLSNTQVIQVSLENVQESTCVDDLNISGDTPITQKANCTDQNVADSLLKLEDKQRIVKRTSTVKFHFIKRRQTRSAANCMINSRYNVQLTKIILLVSTVFIISYIPHFLLMITQMLDEQFLVQMSFVQSSIYYVFLRSFLVNAVANPFIYGTMDKKFRDECKKLCMRNTGTTSNIKSNDLSVIASYAKTTSDI